MSGRVVSSLTHETSADRFGYHVGNKSLKGIFDEDDKHHSDQSYLTHVFVLGLLVQPLEDKKPISSTKHVNFGPQL